jgi:hypothetical protein
VILNEQKASIIFLSDLGHVTLFSADFRELPKFPFERVSGFDPLAVIHPLPRTA